MRIGDSVRWMVRTACWAGFAVALSACVHTRTEIVPSLDTPAHPGPAVPEPPSARADGKGPTAFAMEHVDFHAAPGVVLHVQQLRGALESIRAGEPVIFDDTHSFVMRIATADAAVTTDDLARLLNNYVFAYPKAPLIDLQVSADGAQIRLRGKLRKGGDVPFNIVGDISATPAGEIRVHPTHIDVARLPAGGLLHSVGIKLDKLVNFEGSRGARVAGNDIYLQPDSMLPPPHIRGHLVAAHMDGNAVRLTFNDPALAAMASDAEHPPEPAANWIYFRHGTILIGRLFMVDADLEMIDEAPADPFDFSLDEYVRQLVAGYVKNTFARGLIVHAPDLHTLDSTRVVSP